MSKFVLFRTKYYKNNALLDLVCSVFAFPPFFLYLNLQLSFFFFPFLSLFLPFFFFENSKLANFFYWLWNQPVKK